MRARTRLHAPPPTLPQIARLICGGWITVSCKLNVIDLLDNVFYWVDLMFMAAFLLEIIAKVGGLGLTYMKDWVNFIDFVIILASMILTVRHHPRHAASPPRRRAASPPATPPPFVTRAAAPTPQLLVLVASDLLTGAKGSVALLPLFKVSSPPPDPSGPPEPPAGPA